MRRRFQVWNDKAEYRYFFTEFFARMYFDSLPGYACLYWHSKQGGTVLAEKTDKYAYEKRCGCYR